MYLIEGYGTTGAVHSEVLGLRKLFFRMPTLGVPTVNRLIVGSGMRFDPPFHVIVAVSLSELGTAHAHLR